MKPTAAILIIFYIAFIGRVVGQLLVANGLAPWLPSMEEWQSGLLPYPVLVFFQILIIGLMGKMCRDVALGNGYFSEHHPRLASALTKFGWIYLTVMVARYIIRMWTMPDERWFGGCIPIFLHWILAAFILILAARLGKNRTAVQQ
jgi:uncharacterized protein